jgi:hypothetical protein
VPRKFIGLREEFQVHRIQFVDAVEEKAQYARWSSSTNGAARCFFIDMGISASKAGICLV